MRILSAAFGGDLSSHKISTKPLWLLVLLAFTAVIPLSELSFADSPGNDTHLYFFTSQGCAPCEVVKPALAKLDAAGYPVTIVDIRQRPDWGHHFRVDRTPTVIMVRDEKIVGRHAGVISHSELLRWYAASGFVPAATKPTPIGTKVVFSAAEPPEETRSAANLGREDDGFESATMHKGTSTPVNHSEEIALAATVKIKVEDPEGISYATGTVIHSHGNESLVVTCGHVFRESKGSGDITVEYGFADHNISVGSGDLIFYDAEARDIALLVLHTDGDPIPAVDIASKRTTIDIGNDAFSIGCDHGKNPTIRHTRIKNRAAYDGAIKYDIYGRPVDGRSGGGLFNDDGELIGVCNAAVVDFDEGIYTALDTIHWQLEHTNLAHLFQSPQPGASLAANFDSSPKPSPEPSPEPLPDPLPLSIVARPKPEFPSSVPSSNGRTSLVSLQGDRNSSGNRVDSGKEVLIIIRSKDDAIAAKTITLSNPSHRLVDYLQNMPPVKSEVRQLDVAQYRDAIATSDRFRERVRRGKLR